MSVHHKLEAIVMRLDGVRWASNRASAWVKSEMRGWIATRIAKFDAERPSAASGTAL